MNKLFVYGTLQEKSIQLELTNRFQEGELDSIGGFKVLRDYFVDDDYYPRLVEQKDGLVYGKVLEFSDDELIILDEYESEMYTRQFMETNKGDVVEVYMPVLNPQVI